MVFICRLCGKCENDSLGVAIFGEQGLKEALAYKIKLSLDISVSNIVFNCFGLGCRYRVCFTGICEKGVLPVYFVLR